MTIKKPITVLRRSKLAKKPQHFIAKRNIYATSFILTRKKPRWGLYEQWPIELNRRNLWPAITRNEAPEGSPAIEPQPWSCTAKCKIPTSHLAVPLALMLFNTGVRETVRRELRFSNAKSTKTHAIWVRDVTLSVLWSRKSKKFKVMRKVIPV